jgi:hypothetical protein
VIVPVGLTPLESVAVSETVPRKTIVPEAFVLIAGLALLIRTDSFASLQAVAAALLFLSPLYVATNL